VATQGSTAITGFPQDIEQRIVGAAFTVPACTMARISAMLSESSTPNDHGWRAAIYSGNTLVAQSSIVSTVGTTPAVINFPITTVLGAAEYRFCVLADNAAGGANIAGDFSGGAAAFYTDDNVAEVAGDPVFPGTADLGDANPTRYAIEIEYTESGSPATLSSATPSGTLGTATSATLGATTDQTSGTFYGVVDTAGNISGITAAQVKAGQNNASTPAVASNSSAVGGTSPTTGVTGLTANTAYSYAVVQNNVNGDSNVLTGTFTTAVAVANPGNRNFGPSPAVKTLLTM
jgi:hypothetical protein